MSAIRLYELVIKTMTNTVAILFFLLIFTFLVNANLKFGANFWSHVKNEIIRFADRPEKDIEDKDEIIAALRKIRVKIKPYMDAILKD